jgi:hypothetical protein
MMLFKTNNMNHGVSGRSEHVNDEHQDQGRVGRNVKMAK